MNGPHSAGKSAAGGRQALLTKRIYDPPSRADGFRVLIDRIWPRGLTKEKAKVDLWLRDIAPTTGLRQWFGHEPGKWPEFRKRYFGELKGHRDLVELIVAKTKSVPVTILFGAKETRFNNAVALKEFIEKEFEGR